MRLSPNLAKVFIVLSPLLWLLGYLLPGISDSHTARVAEIGTEMNNLFVYSEELQTIETDFHAPLEGQLAENSRLLAEAENSRLLAEAEKLDDDASREEWIMQAKEIVAKQDKIIAKRDEIIAKRDEIIAKRNEILAKNKSTDVERSGTHERLVKLKAEKDDEQQIVSQQIPWKKAAALGCWILAAAFLVIGSRSLSCAEAEAGM